MFGSIVVGTDGSQTAHEAVGQAVQLAQRLEARLHIVCAYEPVARQRSSRGRVSEDVEWAISPLDEAEETLAAAAGLAREAGVEAEVYARQGDGADSILDVAEERDADLVIVGNKGLTGAKRFLLGSVPNKVSHYAPCSVMIIRTS